MNKKYSDVKLHTNARKKILEGARLASEVVGTTLGPRGRNIIIHQYHDTQVLHDGVKVLNSITPKDPFVDAGVSLVKQAARQQVDRVGDGTSAVTVMTHAIASEAMKVVESGVNAMSLRDGLEKGKNLLIEEITKLAKPLETKEDYVNVATISSEDEQMGKIIGETFAKVKLDGVVTVNDDMSAETYVEHQDGLRINSGYKHPMFITNERTDTATVENASVLVTDYKLDNIYDIAPAIKNIVEQNKKTHLVFFCEDMTGNVLATMIGNKRAGNLQVSAVTAPSFKTTDTLLDIATMVGARFISKEANMDLKDVTVADLGFAKKITSTKDTTVVIGGGGNKESIQDRISLIKDLIEDENNEFERQKLRERLARMTGGVHVINVGAHTEAEHREKKERAIDAVEATRSAIEGGIVAGGETIYLNIKNVLKPTSESEEYAYRILTKALQVPFNRLLENAGLNSGQYLEKLSTYPQGSGVNVENGEVLDLFEAGIIDPALISTNVISNAISIAIQIITSDGVVDIYDEVSAVQSK